MGTPQSLTALLDPCRHVWSQALQLPPRSLRGTMLWELQSYYHLSRGEVLDRCRAASRRIAQAWRQADPHRPEDVDAFYRRPLDYAFELLWWHSFAAGDRNFLNLLPAMHYAQLRGASRVLDFGGGIGSHAIVMARNGLHVTIGDVSEEMLMFAAWRAQQRGCQLRCLHLGHMGLEPHYDFIVASDVLEHLPSPAETVASLCRHLRMGGYLFISMPAGLSPSVPQHISFWGEQLIIDRGLRDVMQFGAVALLMQKVADVEAHGSPPRYGRRLEPGRPALCPSISPGLWWEQTRAWRRATRRR